MQSINFTAKPFLKWAGGKSQLLEQISDRLPTELINGKIQRYVEPFIGGGALFFHIAQTYDVKEFFISDINEELILVYKSIQRNVDNLIEILKDIENKYYKLNVEKQKEYFYQIRFLFNEQRAKINFQKFQKAWIERAAHIIFLNRTCFNGLFRVNSRGEFNVPFGRYKNPLICSELNLKASSKLLQHTEIHHGDFTDCQSFVNAKTFVYFDPPYRPISKTANFTSYTKYDFNDTSQQSLAKFYKLLNRKGAKLLLSNSDPKNENPKDNFFEIAYKKFNIERVNANRIINCNAEKRGAIKELLIRNY